MAYTITNTSRVTDGSLIPPTEFVSNPAVTQINVPIPPNPPRPTFVLCCFRCGNNVGAGRVVAAHAIDVAGALDAVTGVLDAIEGSPFNKNSPA